MTNIFSNNNQMTITKYLYTNYFKYDNNLY